MATATRFSPHCTPREKLLPRLQAKSTKPGHWEARCPAHDDKNPSLSVTEDGDGGKILLHCHAGCELTAILAAVGLDRKDLFPAADYRSCRQEPKPPNKAKSKSVAGGTKPIKDWASEARQYASNLQPAQRQQLAEALGLPEATMAALPLLGYSATGLHADRRAEDCWTFPEVDGDGCIVGITARYRDGAKKALADGRRGLIVPDGWREREGNLFLPEGPSDTLALTALGLPALGRPNNTGGVEQLAALLKDVDRPIVVVGEYDPKTDGKWPGRDGAAKTAAALSAKLGRPVSWVLPPSGAKDVRAWVNAQQLPMDCGDSWSEAGERLLEQWHDDYIATEPTQQTACDGIDLADLIDDDNEHIEYLPFLGRLGYIPRGWSILFAGYPRAGKTEAIFACLPSWLDNGETVAYLSEEPRNIWGHRKRRAGFERRGVRLVLALGMDRETLMSRAMDGPETVVVIDTIRNLGVLPADDSDNSAVARALAPWITAARANGKTLILLHHLRKGAGEHGEGISGGHAIFGAVDVALELRRDTQANRRVVKGYARIIQVPDLMYEQDENLQLVVLGDPSAVSQLEVKARVAGLLGSEWKKTAEVEEMLEEPKPSDEVIRQALTAAAREGKIERDPPISDGKVRGKTFRWRAVAA